MNFEVRVAPIGGIVTTNRWERIPLLGFIDDVHTTFPPRSRQSQSSRISPMRDPEAHRLADVQDESEQYRRTERDRVSRGL